MNKPLNCAIIGCGVIGPTHTEAYQALDSVTVAWACDLVMAKAAGLAQRYGVAKTTTDYNEVLADPSIDCISVCTDHASHAQISMAALAAGKHVVCEKALAAHPTQLDAMLAAHRDNPQLVFAGIFQHRFDALARCLKQIIDDGLLGTMLTAGLQVHCLRTAAYYQADAWRGTWELEGGALLINQAIHFVDQLGWLTGGVDALCGTFNKRTHGAELECEDTAVASLRLHNGALAVLEATSSSHLRWEPTLAFHGDQGSLEVRQGKPLKVAFADPERQSEVEQRLATCRDVDNLAAAKSYYGAGHRGQIADFVAAIHEQRPPFVTAASARHAVDIAHAIYASHHSGGWVDIASKP